MTSKLFKAAQDLEYVNEVLNGLRFAGTDQNPKGIRDLLFSALTKIKQEARPNYACQNLAIALSDTVNALAASEENSNLYTVASVFNRNVDVIAEAPGRAFYAFSVWFWQQEIR